MRGSVTSYTLNKMLHNNGIFKLITNVMSTLLCYISSGQSIFQNLQWQVELCIP